MSMKQIVDSLQAQLDEFSYRNKVPKCGIYVQYKDRLYTASVGYNDADALASERVNISCFIKPITALVLLKLLEKSQFDVETSLSEIFADFDINEIRGVTISSLLSHTHGIIGPSKVEFKRPGINLENTFSLFKDDLLAGDGKRGFYYNSCGYLMLGLLIEKLSGKSYSETVINELFDPLEIRYRNSLLPKKTEPGKLVSSFCPSSGAGLNLRFDDLFRLMGLFKNNQFSDSNGQQVISDAVMENIYKPGFPAMSGHVNFTRIGMGLYQFSDAVFGHNARSDKNHMFFRTSQSHDFSLILNTGKVQPYQLYQTLFGQYFNEYDYEGYLVNDVDKLLLKQKQYKKIDNKKLKAFYGVYRSPAGAIHLSDKTKVFISNHGNEVLNMEFRQIDDVQFDVFLDRNWTTRMLFLGYNEPHEENLIFDCESWMTFVKIKS